LSSCSACAFIDPLPLERSVSVDTCLPPAATVGVLASRRLSGGGVLASACFFGAAVPPLLGSRGTAAPVAFDGDDGVGDTAPVEVVSSCSSDSSSRWSVARVFWSRFLMLFSSLGASAGVGVGAGATLLVAAAAVGANVSVACSSTSDSVSVSSRGIGGDDPIRRLLLFLRVSSSSFSYLPVASRSTLVHSTYSTHTIVSA
jgi:hypothetical protein